MKKSTFQEVAGRYAQVIGRNSGVKVVFAGSIAKTDGKVVQLPALPADVLMSDHEVRILSGFLDHETAHVRFTDFGAFEGACKKDGPVFQMVLNIIEDVRIESLCVRAYPGSLPYLNELEQFLVKKIEDRMAVLGKKVPKEMEFLARLYYQVGQYRTGQVKHSFNLEGERKYQELVSLIEWEVPSLKSTVDAVTLAKKCHVLIKKIMKDEPPLEAEKPVDQKNEKKEETKSGEEQGLKRPEKKSEEKKPEEKKQEPKKEQKSEEKKPEESNEEKDSDEGQESEDSDEGQESEDSDEGQDAIHKDSEESGAEAEMDSGDEDGEDSEGSGEGSMGTSEAGSRTGDSLDKEGQPSQLGNSIPDSGNYLGTTQQAAECPENFVSDPMNSSKIEEFAGDLMKALDRQNGVNALLDLVQERERDCTPRQAIQGNALGPILNPASMENDRVWEKVGENKNGYLDRKSRLTAEVNALKKGTRIYLQSRAHKAWSRGLDEGTLDVRALHKLRTGSSRIYKEKREREFINTAMMLMVDWSGSMDVDDVMKATIVLSEALNAVPQLKMAIAGFTTLSVAIEYYRNHRGSYETGLGRNQPLHIPLFKDFDEPYQKIAGRLGTKVPQGNTPLGEGYANAFQALVRRPEKKRVLWLVTDGDPWINVQDSRHSERALMARTHEKCIKAGIQTVGLSIGRYDKLSGYCDIVTQIEDCNEFSVKVLETMREVVVNPRLK